MPYFPQKNIIVSADWWTILYCCCTFECLAKDRSGYILEPEKSLHSGCVIDGFLLWFLGSVFWELNIDVFLKVVLSEVYRIWRIVRRNGGARLILYSWTSFIVDVCFILGSVFWDLTNVGADLVSYSWKYILDNIFLEMYPRYCILGSVFSIWRMVARSRWCTLDAPASSLSATIRRPLNPSLRPGLISIASTDSSFSDGIFKTRARKWTHILETGIDMVHRKGGYKCTHKSQNHRSRSLPQTPISVMESSKPGIESCSKWLHASGTGSNMVHNKVGYDMCLCIL